MHHMHERPMHGRRMGEYMVSATATHLLVGQALLHAAELDAHNVAELVLAQRVEDDELVDAVQELGPEHRAHRGRDLRDAGGASVVTHIRTYLISLDKPHEAHSLKYKQRDRLPRL